MTKNCKQCQGEFNTNYSFQEFCSTRCSQLFRYLRDRDKILANRKTPESKSKNREYQRTPERQKYYREYQSLKRQTDPIFKLRQSIKDRIRKDGKGTVKLNNTNVEIVVGYTIKEAWSYLVTTIPEGMTEQDYLEGKLEIDHIIPVLCYTYFGIDNEFRKCYHFKNMRLIKVLDNRDRDKGIDWKLVRAFDISSLLPEASTITYDKYCQGIK